MRLEAHLVYPKRGLKRCGAVFFGRACRVFAVAVPKKCKREREAAQTRFSDMVSAPLVGTPARTAIRAGVKVLPREADGYWISVGLRMISFGGILLMPSLPRMSGP
jgi:hypothetical protein